MYQLRTRRDLSVIDLADLANVSRSTVHALETDSRDVSTETACKVLLALDVSLERALHLTKHLSGRVSSAGSQPSTELGKFLRRLREAAAMSQNELGLEADVDPSFINRIESGERSTMSEEVVLKLVRVLDATPVDGEWLVFVAGNASTFMVETMLAHPELSRQLLTEAANRRAQARAETKKWPPNRSKD